MRKTREMFGKLNISDFYQLYKEFDIWTNEVSRFRIYMRVQLNQLIAHSTIKSLTAQPTSKSTNQSPSYIHLRASGYPEKVSVAGIALFSCIPDNLGCSHYSDALEIPLLGS